MKPILQPKEPPERDTLVSLIASFQNVVSEEEKRKLQTQFYNHFKDKFYDRCHKIVYKLYSSSPDWEKIKDDLFQDTFIVAFKKIETFEIHDNWDNDECQKVVLNWMSKIANITLINYIKKDKEEKKNLKEYKYTLTTDNLEGEIAKRNYEPTFDREKFNALWEKCNEKKRAIILAYAKFDTLGEDNTKHLPDDEMLKLTDRFQIKSSAVRKIKERLIKDLKSCLIEK